MSKTKIALRKNIAGRPIGQKAGGDMSKKSFSKAGEVDRLEYLDVCTDIVRAAAKAGADLNLDNETKLRLMEAVGVAIERFYAAEGGTT